MEKINVIERRTRDARIVERYKELKTAGEKAPWAVLECEFTDLSRSALAAIVKRTSAAAGEA